MPDDEPVQLRRSTRWPRSSPPRATGSRATFEAPTAAQAQGWPAIAAGEHTLICAPTGSGKTLAAFLWCLDRLMSEPPPADPLRRLRVLYVSPLKALVHDVDRNLRSPLAGIALAARSARRGDAADVRVGMRTGDTPADERRAFGKQPPDILVTTPESLYLLLTSQAREALRGVEWVIVDEIHALAGTKRGAHLALSLERLAALTARAAAAHRAVGHAATAERRGRLPRRPRRRPGDGAAPGAPRPVTIVDAGVRKPLELQVVVPGRGHEPRSASRSRSRSCPAARRRPRTQRTSIWPSGLSRASSS